MVAGSNDGRALGPGSVQTGIPQGMAYEDRLLELFERYVRARELRVARVAIELERRDRRVVHSRHVRQATTSLPLQKHTHTRGGAGVHPIINSSATGFGFGFLKFAPSVSVPRN